MQLNPRQEEAKNKIEWSVLIIAWAGSWKTATLTKRVSYMIEEKNILPQNILMVTFTNKAASEMRERIWKTLWIEVSNIYKNRNNIPMIGTFHSIWIFLLKEVLNNFNHDELNIWLKKDFLIYDESDKISVLRWIIKNDLKLDEKKFKAKVIASYISNAKNALISAKAYEKEIDSSLKEIVFSVYLKYEEKLKQNNAMDFDDILVKTLNILKIPKILEIYWERYKYIMVDEYQDTNVPQYEIVKLLANKYRNLAVVWDDSQSIYSWRWSDMRNILNFRKDYPDALIVKLEQNYRSTKVIIAWANAVITNNSTWIKKELWTDNQEWDKINYIQAHDDKLEASIIAGIIKEKKEEKNPLSQPFPPMEKGVKIPSPLGGGLGRGLFSDNLILYRTNAQSRQIEEALIMKNIPYRVVWWLKFYDRKEIKDLLWYLRIIYNWDDVISKKRIINVPARKIWAKSIEILDNYKEQFNISYPQIIENIDEVLELKAWAKWALKLFWHTYSELKKASTELVVSELINLILNKVKYIDYITEWLGGDEAMAKKDNIDELLTVASQYNWMDPRESLWQFLEEVALITDMDTKDEREDYVTLMTIHTSKWLEEKRVFVTWLEDGIFPSFRSVNDAYALEEERRLMYVAMTRAREELYISRAKERFHFWDYVRNPESRFMWEIPGIHMEEYVITESTFGWNSLFWWWLWNNNRERMPAFLTSIPKPKVNNDVSIFSIWDKVSHPKFGTWIITSLSWELAEIWFSWGGGIKKMNIRIAPVKKVG